MWADITDMEVPITMDILKYKRIAVTVLDKNMFMSDSWMGKGDFSLRKLGSNTKDGAVLVAHTVRLKDKRGRAAGKVVIEAEIQPLPDLAALNAAAALQAPGVVSFLNCKVSGVADHGVAGKQDLRVKLRLVDWTKETDST